MFEFGWTEMLVIAIVLIVVVGPKDLPKMLRTFGKMTAKMTSMAGDFRKQFDEAMREAELDDVKKTIDSAKKLNPTSELKKALNPMEKAAQDVKTGLDLMMKKDTSAMPASAEAPAPAEPLKAGPVAVPGEAAAKPNGAAAPKLAATAPATPAPKPVSKPAKPATAGKPAAKAAKTARTPAPKKGRASS